jgi:transposase
MQYVGLDVHQRTSTIHILDECGRKVKEKTIRGSWQDVVLWLARWKEPFAVCFEASCGYGPLYDGLSKIAPRVVMAHPGQLRLIFRSKRKSDRVDAEKLAKLLYLDEVPPAHVPGIEVRQWRELIEFRRRLVDRQTACKNQIRSLLRSHGVRAPKSLWSRAGQAWLLALDWPGLSGRVRRDMLTEELRSCREKVRTVTRALDQMARRHPGVQLLRTIPGIGARTAETVMAYLDDASRFDRSSQVGAYFGLVPCQDASAGTNRLGHITKQGPGTARKYLVQGAWQAVLRSPRVRARYERLTDGRKERRKIALVAIAHWLLRCMFAMLRSGQAWREAA